MTEYAPFMVCVTPHQGPYDFIPFLDAVDRVGLIHRLRLGFNKLTTMEGSYYQEPAMDSDYLMAWYTVDL